MSEPAYGASQHYLGEKGQQYFALQRYQLSSDVNAQFFQPYISPKSSVLDFGCGAGDLLSALNADTKVGIEINPVARDAARSRGLEMFSQISEVQGRRFDFVITSHALEHVPSPYHALVELRELLNPDGMLIWLSPLDDWRTRFGRRWSSGNHDMHLYAWTPLTLGNLLVTAGYQPTDIRLIAHAIPPRFAQQIWNFSHRLFDYAAYSSAVLLKRRQILAVAHPCK